MFAVKGWSVSADKLKAETLTGAAAPVQDTAKPEQKTTSKKRKRPQAEVTSSNVADLWDRVIGGKPAGGNKKKAKTQSAGGNAGVAQSQTSPQVASTKAREHGNKPGKSSDASPPQIDDQAGAVVDGKKAKKQKSKNKDQVQESAADAVVSKGQPQHQNNGISRDAPVETAGKKSKKNKKAARDHEQSLDSQAQQASKETSSRTQDGNKLLAKTAPAPPPANPKLTPLQAAMREKLISARFRHLNEMLYTRPSAEAFQLLEDTPEMFTEYHEGFRRQVDVWPENPVDGYLADIKQRGQLKGPPKGKAAGGRNNNNNNSSAPTASEPLPRTNGTCTIADLGCGDAKLAAELQAKKKALRLDILSYDLQSPSPHVTRADIANLPLADGSVNVAIFCLALMGTNWLDFVEEAYRVLHWKGELWVAEIKSRLGHVGAAGGKKAPGNVVTHSVGNRKKAAAAGKKAGKAGDDDRAHDAALAIEVDGAEDRRQETDVKAFVEALRKRGFVLQGEADLRNKMFVKMHFIKAAPATVGKNAFPPAAGGGRGGGGGGGNNGGRDSRMGRVSSKFVDAESESSKVDEGGILKPCVYKIR
ncbi:methyltransferase-domain-containing protein [Microdochium bolleyi]|uniref:Ribosomal RNA-processing protein 8 n=1 Tax=Microdochium bolleyi TaxID=196109 RepID=A0A136J4Z9_9PEZI|nr:methyltransferase-domain-containing protein [Microdochium bolleyi]